MTDDKSNRIATTPHAYTAPWEQALADYVDPFVCDDPTGHDIYHCLRVKRLALRIGLGTVLVTRQWLTMAFDALRLLQRALALDAWNPAAHYYLGLIHEERGDFGAALDEFNEALACDTMGANTPNIKKAIARVKETMQPKPY